MTTYAEDLASNKKYQGNIIIRLAGVYYGSFQPDSGLVLDSDKVGLVKTLTENASKVDLKRANQTIPSINFTFVDRDQVITKLLKDNATLLVNESIEIYVGRVNVGMDFTDYLQLQDVEVTKLQRRANEYIFRCKDVINSMDRPIFSVLTELAVDILAATTVITLEDTTNLPTTGFGRIEGDDTEFISWTGISGNNLTGVTRAEFGSTAQDHSSGTRFDQVTEITGNPIDIMLQVLISGGGGGPYDVLSDGLGIDPAKIDITEIEGVRNDLFVGETVTFKMFNIPSALKWIEKEIHLLNNTRFRFNSNKKLGLAVLDQATLDLADTLVDEETINSNPRWEVDVKEVVNRIEIYWDWDDVAEMYKKTTIFEDTESQTNFKEQRPLELRFKGPRASTGGQDIVNDRGARLLERFKDIRPQIRITTHISNSLLNVGDKVSVVTNQLPSAKGTLEFSDTLEVISRQIVHRYGLVNFILAYTSFSGIRPGFIAPTGYIDSVTSQQCLVFDAGKGQQWLPGYKVRLFNCDTQSYEPDPINTVLSINGDEVCFETAWATTIDPAKHVIRFADYDDVTEQQKRFAFVSDNLEADFADGTAVYRITR